MPTATFCKKNIEMHGYTSEILERMRLVVYVIVNWVE